MRALRRQTWDTRVNATQSEQGSGVLEIHELSREAREGKRRDHERNREREREREREEKEERRMKRLRKRGEERRWKGS